ncbi:MAG: hypothetical protein BWY70_01437 [Bacteroidetes bacterium ADurb.Bin408]|nr:MAG: hypothetical protein BWY70_01437 [Bacteroidetes bacterium ADurb.Bin408]
MIIIAIFIITVIPPVAAYNKGCVFVATINRKVLFIAAPVAFVAAQAFYMYFGFG